MAAEDGPVFMCLLFLSMVIFLRSSCCFIGIIHGFIGFSVNFYHRITIKLNAAAILNTTITITATITIAI